MYFSYDKSSDANLYPLTAEEVRRVQKMNREGIKPDSLRPDMTPAAPEFVSAVGDDSISRFDKPKRPKKKKKSNNNHHKPRQNNK